MGTRQDDRTHLYRFAKTLSFAGILPATRNRGSESIVGVDYTRPVRTHLIAVLVALAAALVARAVLQLELREVGLQRQFAADLSYLVVPPLLAVLLFPVLKASRGRLRERFNTAHLNARLVINALALGALLRLAWWCHLIAGVSLGIYQNDVPDLVSGPVIVFRCPPAYLLATSVLVMSILVPLVEEIIHSGLMDRFPLVNSWCDALVANEAVKNSVSPEFEATFIEGLRRRKGYAGKLLEEEEQSA